jgi:hypothetical protein
MINPEVDNLFQYQWKSTVFRIGMLRQGLLLCAKSENNSYQVAHVSGDTFLWPFGVTSTLVDNVPIASVPKWCLLELFQSK